MKMFETFLVLLCSDKLLLCYLLTSAHVCWCRTGFSCCPTFPDSLSFPFTYFPSLTCVISFFTPTSLPPLLLTFSSFSPPSCSLHPSHYFGSIHLITLHLLSTLASPTYSPSFPHLIHFYSLFLRSWKYLHKLSAFVVCFFPLHFSQTPAHLFHFSTAPSIQFKFLLANCPIL